MCIADSHLAEVQDCASAHEMWASLCGRYQRNTTATKAYLIKQLFNLKMAEGSLISDHLNNMAELTSRLASLKRPVNEEYMIAILLNSLPPSWDSFVSIQEDNDELTLEILKSKLLQQEFKQKESKADIALYSRQHHNTGSSSNNHYMQGKNQHRSQHSSSKRTFCTFCKSWGHHTADKCFKRKAASAQARQDPQ